MDAKDRQLVWETGEDRPLYHTPIFDVVSFDTVNPRNGVQAEFYGLRCPMWVNIIAVTEDHKLVMVRQFRHGSRTVELEIPAGLMEPGEDPVDAARRELLEETGYTPAAAGRILATFYPNASFQDNLCHAVLFDRVSLTHEAQPEALEALEVTTLSIPEIKTALRDGVIAHGTIAVSIFHYLLSLEKQ